MKIKFIKTLIFIFVLILFSVSYVSAEELSERLKGKILLQVEDVGQAWYVEPETKQRAFLGRPADAFRIMRELGLGISEKDFNSFGEKAPGRLSGRILLRVELHGEAYYVNSNDLKMYYLGRPHDAFNIMRERGLGITNDNLNQITVHENYSEETVQENNALIGLQKQLEGQAKLIEELQEQQAQKERQSDIENMNQQNETGEITPLTAGQVFEKVAPAVVFIETSKGNGSGFIYDSDGYIVTNEHVVRGVENAFITLKSGATLTGEVLGKDFAVDLAIIKIGGKNFPNVEFGNINKLKQGDDVYSLGYPESLWVGFDQISIKEGIYSRRVELDSYFLLEHTAEILHGSSGGPLADKYGEVIGVNSGGYTSDEISDPLKFAVPISTVKAFIPILKGGN
jgi:hypothetical protein